MNNQNLVCKECDKEYEIKGGVPIMLSKLKGGLKKSYQTFSEEWRIHKKGEKLWGRSKQERKELFWEQIGGKVNKGILLDAGCGIGETEDLIVDNFDIIIAMDLSDSVFNAQKNNKYKDKVFFVQGDVGKLPFRDNIFDYVYSEGVIHHSPNPRVSFNELSRVNRGKLYIWVYLKMSHTGRNKFTSIIYQSLRSVIGRMPFPMQKFIINWMGQPIGNIIYYLGGRREGETNQERLVLLWDAFGVRYAHHFTMKEIKNWFKDNNLENIIISDKTEDIGFGTYGVKNSREKKK